MKKIIAFLLAACMVFSMCGCGLIDSFMEGFQEVVDKPEDSEKPEEEKKETKKEFALGEVTETTYENAFLGLGFTLPEGWRFYSEDEIKSLNQVATEMAGEDYAKLMENTGSFYDMMACSSTQMENVNISVEKNDALKNVTDMKIVYEASRGMVEESMKNMGATDIQCTLDTAVFNGETVDVMYISSKVAGYDLEQVSLSLKADGYLVGLTATSSDKANLQSILDKFYRVD